MKGFVDFISNGKKIVWNKKVENSRLECFRKAVEEKYSIKFDSYFDLHEWSVKNYDKFWQNIWHYFGVICSKNYEEVIVKGNDIFEVEWFKGARLNYAENILRYRDDHLALICLDENDNEEMVTYPEMYKEVKLYASALRKFGLKVGDRVACYMSNRKEAIYTMLAATSIGAIFGGPTPFFGSKTAADIVNSMSPVLLFIGDRMRCDGAEISLIDNLPEIIRRAPSLKKVVIVPTREETRLKNIAEIGKRFFKRNVQFELLLDLLKQFQLFAEEFVDTEFLHELLNKFEYNRKCFKIFEGSHRLIYG